MKKKVQPEKILRVVANFLHLSPEELLQRGHKGVARSIAMEMLYRYGGVNQREIGELMGIDYSTVSVARKGLAGILEKHAGLAKEFDRLKKLLIQE
jgi:chromosomal replication initiation ATPase DnaA